jgi:hypothetical protein
MAEDAPASGTIPLAIAARLIMVTERHVQSLAASGWIPKPYTVAGVVQGYIRWLKDDTRKRAGDEDIRRERARALKMANDESERMLLRADDAMAAIDAIYGIVRSDLAGVAARATDDLALRRRIENAIDDVLAGIADRCERAGQDLLAGRDALAAPPASPHDRRPLSGRPVLGGAGPQILEQEPTIAELAAKVADLTKPVFLRYDMVTAAQTEVGRRDGRRQICKIALGTQR